VVSVRSSSRATWPTVLPVVPSSSTTSALDSGGKNRRGRGIGLPSRGQGPHLGCPPDRVNSSWAGTFRATMSFLAGFPVMRRAVRGTEEGRCGHEASLLPCLP
jgi:hypothetical protein